jgi:GNAT superfamily N-acetyltransferase
MAISFTWRGSFDSGEVSALHSEGFDHEPSTADWWVQVNQHSLGWVCAREGRELVGFVNVAWDGGAHAFVLDTLVTNKVQRQGVGAELIAVAARKARVARCEWLHVDFEDRLRPFYVDACGFVPTSGGVIPLEPSL